MISSFECTLFHPRRVFGDLGRLLRDCGLSWIIPFMFLFKVSDKYGRAASRESVSMKHFRCWESRNASRHWNKHLKSVSAKMLRPEYSNVGSNSFLFFFFFFFPYALTFSSRVSEIDSSKTETGHLHCCKHEFQSKSVTIIMANRVDPDETALYEPSHLVLHCLQSYMF